MSKCFGYADDFKVVSDSSVTIQIDPASLWKWSIENFMHFYLYKFSLMFFKGDASVHLGGVEVEERATQKDSGLLVRSFLTWTSQAKFRCGIAV